MSRTDKDTPAWVTTPLWEEYHGYRCRSGTQRCTLPREPIVHHPHVSFSRCRWCPVVQYYSYDRLNGLSAWWFRSVPKWYVDHVYHNRSRRAARDDLLQAAKEYRATGEVDTEHWFPQGRNSAKWMWD